MTVTAWSFLSFGVTALGHDDFLSPQNQSISSCTVLPTDGDWTAVIKGGSTWNRKSYCFQKGTYYLDKHFQIPDNVILSGESPDTSIIVASQAVNNGCGKKAGGDPSTRIGFVLGNNVDVKHFTFVGQDTHRWQGYDGAALCGGGVFETPGCSDAYCDSTENIGSHNGNGVSQVLIEDVYITNSDNSNAPQLAVFITQTRDPMEPSHDITIKGLTMDKSWCDGINVHGASHHVTVQDCDLSFQGDDNLAVWSYGDAAHDISFLNNKLSQARTTNPHTSWGNCIVLYGGGANIKVSGNSCEGANDAGVKFSEAFGGKFSGKTQVTVDGMTTDNGKPDCLFTEGRSKDWNVQGCWPNLGEIRSFWSGRCLDIPGGKAFNGQAMQVWECTGAKSQQWEFAAGSYQIQSKHSDYCLDGGEMAQGGQIQLWECNGLPQQQFGYDSNVETIYFTNTHSDATLCLDLQGQSLDMGAAVQVWECNEMANQAWEVNMGSQDV